MDAKVLLISHSNLETAGAGVSATQEREVVELIVSGLASSRRDLRGSVVK